MYQTGIGNRKLELVLAFIIGLLVLGLNGCGSKTQDGGSTLQDERAKSGHMELARVIVKHDEKAGEKPEFVYLGAGLEMDGKTCSFRRISKEDGATPWPPVQAVWGVYENTKYKSLAEHYSGLGRLSAKDVAGGIAGFRDIGWLEKQFVSVSDPQMSSSGDAISMKIDLPVSSMQVVDADQKSSTVQGEAVDLTAKLALRDGKCVSSVNYCIVGDDCSRNGKKRTLSKITVQRAPGSFGGAESVVIR